MYSELEERLNQYMDVFVKPDNYQPSALPDDELEHMINSPRDFYNEQQQPYLATSQVN